MSVFTYTAKRRIAPGHTAGVQYSIDMGIRSHNPTDIYEGNQAFSASQSSTSISKEMIYHKITTKRLNYQQMQEFREFLNSTNGSEPITFDLFGSVASPDNPIQVEKLFDKKIEPRYIENGAYRFTFTLIEYL
ncbi:hypothetical protein FLL45_01570 [Aliikangiella marina]|uniref:Phage tail protein n=1 Tax=Aliikangiella marina TaxID=1712262 RepID=A0A545THL0_9GAMM|nr:hypothetical protein [Aliikangiella marina]TQV76676.1 hypothetical protein FLL45_01570 [Aliikangiella marina]